MNISTEQQNILDRAIELLREYDHENVSNYTTYFVISEDDYSEIGDEYDCCDNSECYEKVLKELREEYPDCTYIYQHYDGDYENINCCTQCGRKLNDRLTWIYWELNDMEDILNPNEIKESYLAFRLRVIFEAMPTDDLEITEYDRADSKRLKEAQKRQDKFVCRVINYAEQVISALDGGEKNDEQSIER